MRLGDALDRLDRRVLGKHAEPGLPPKRPVRFAVLWILGMGLFLFLSQLATGFTLAEAAGSLLTYLVSAAISAPFLVCFLRRRSRRDGLGGGALEN